MISHALGGGKYIWRAHTSLRAVVWVSGTEQLGLSIHHRPSTPAISVPLMEQSITRKICVLYLSICTYPDLLGECFSQYDLSCLTISWVGHYLHPLNPVSNKAKITAFHSRLQRLDKLLLWYESLPIHLAYLCTLSHFWHLWVGSTQRRRIPDLV